MFQRMLFNRFVKWASRKRNRGHKVFNFALFDDSATGNTCGTMGCLAGELPIFDKKNWTFWHNAPIKRSSFSVNTFSQIGEYFGIRYHEVSKLFSSCSAEFDGYKKTNAYSSIREVLFNLRHFEKIRTVTEEEFKFIIDDFVSKGFGILRGAFWTNDNDKLIDPLTMLGLTRLGTYNVKQIKKVNLNEDLFGININSFYRTFDDITSHRTLNIKPDNTLAINIANYCLTKYGDKIQSA